MLCKQGLFLCNVERWEAPGYCEQFNAYIMEPQTPQVSNSYATVKIREAHPQAIEQVLNVLH